MRKNWKTSLIFLAISTTVLFLNAFPNYYAYLQTPPGFSFSGQASWFDPWDINVYVSAISWGQSGHLLLENAYTTINHTPILMYPLYTFAGFILRDISPFLLFHILAAIFGLVLLFTIWKLANIFLENNRTALIAITLISLGGGIGWMFFPQVPSADLYMTGFTFISHFQRSHEALGMIFYLLSLGLFFQFTQTNSAKYYLLSLLFLLFLIFLYPYYLLSFSFICGIYSLYLYFLQGVTRFVKYLAIEISLVFFGFIFYWLHLKSSNGFSGVLSQQLSNPDLIQLILGYGLLLPIFAFQLLKKSQERGAFFLNLWFIVSVLLAFLPLGFARFYLRSLYFPLVMLAIFALPQIAKKLKVPFWVCQIILVFVLPISSLYMTYHRLNETEKGSPWYYLSPREKGAISFIQKSLPMQSMILTGYTLGNYIPAYTSSRVYFGHLLQTPSAQKKVENLTSFYANTLSEDQAKAFLENNHINYIFYGKEEEKINQLYANPSTFPYRFLKPIFQEGDTILYEYQKDEN